MPIIRVDHRTSYVSQQSLVFGPHRLMLRPREGRHLRLLSHEMSITPDAHLDWTTDVFGNAVATATFAEPASSLFINSRAELELSSPAWPIFAIAASAINFPFRYDDDEWVDLGALASLQYADPHNVLGNWARSFIASSPTDTLSLLKDLNAGVSKAFAYQTRDDEGTQPPVQTIARGWGFCRDFAVLLSEAARSLGFGARIVSGYLFNPDHLALGSAGRGATHAWVEIFLSGAGWIPFDPTNNTMGGANLIPVSVTRTIKQSAPISGEFTGPSNAYPHMRVSVEVHEVKTGQNEQEQA